LSLKNPTYVLFVLVLVVAWSQQPSGCWGMWTHIQLYFDEYDTRPQRCLSIFLASMAHHSNWMLGVLAKDPSHPFDKISVSTPLK
jgi:hypothetical protein